MSIIFLSQTKLNVNLKGTEQLELNIFEIPESDERNI